MLIKGGKYVETMSAENQLFDLAFTTSIPYAQISGKAKKVDAKI